MEKLQLNCKFCGQDFSGKSYQSIFCVMIDTETGLHYIGLQKILHELAEFLMQKNYHLSASEILLLRPDIVKIFLKEKFNKEVTEYYFKNYKICEKCYEEYVKIIPLV